MSVSRQSGIGEPITRVLCFCRTWRESRDERGMRTSAKVSTATSCLPASAEAFAALYRRSAETSVPSVSDEASVTRGWRGRGVSRVREKQQFDSAMGNQSVPKRHASASRVLAVRDARPSGASSTTRTRHSRESVRQPLEVVPGASRELARLQPRGPRFFVPLREDAGVRFHPGDVRGPGNARLPALGHDVRRDGFHRVGSTHAPLERDTRRARREVAWSRRTRGPMCVQRRFRISYTNNAGRDATPKSIFLAQKSRKLGRRTRAVDLVPRA